MTRENTAIPDDSPEVRALLRAGMSEEVDYDFEKGLSTHLAAIGAIPMAPHPAAPGAAAAGTAPSAAAGLSAKALFTLVGIPLASASVVAALWLGSNSKGHASGPQLEPAAPKSIAVPAAAPAVTEPAMASPAPASADSNPSATDQTGAPDRSTHAPRSWMNHRHAVTLSETAEVVNGAESAPIAAGNAHSVLAPSDSTATATSAQPMPSAAETATAEEPSKPEAKPDDVRAQAQERLAREIDQLVQAKRALSSDPKGALLLAEQGQREFPHSVFAEERQQILLLALIGVGRVDDARRLAAPYLRSHPDSPFAKRVQSALAGAAAR